MRSAYRHLWLFATCIALPVFAQPSTHSIRWAQQKTEHLNHLITEITAARGRPDEAIVIRQMSAALADGAVVDMGEGDFRALSLLRQLQTTGDIGGPASRWQATGSDGTQIVCIVSPTNSQIIWQKIHSEMNPSVRRWKENCMFSAPAIQKYIAASVASAERYLEGQLRDPEGTRYRNVHVMASLSRVILCGEINMRNGFGGFNGYGHFIAASSAAELPDSGDGDSWHVVADWPKFCTNFAVYRDMGEINLSRQTR